MMVSEAVALARCLFLDEPGRFGCAEATYLALAAAYGLEDAPDASIAMALNGGVAYGGGTCGAITGAALAVGLLAGRRVVDQGEAKRAARLLTADLMDAFATEHGALDCRSLIGVDLRAPGAHDAFMTGGEWRETCTRQIVFAVERMAPLADRAAWDRALATGQRP